MAKFAVLIKKSTDASAAWTALEFCKALLPAHQLQTIFFYQDSVQLGLKNLYVPSNETNCQEEWQNFAKKNNLSLMLCSTGAKRRGIHPGTLAEKFELTSLGTWFTKMQTADRVITFGS